MIPMPPRIGMRVNRIKQVLTYYHFLMNGNGHYCKSHHHKYHHSSFYIYFLYHSKDSSWSKKPGCYFVTRQGNFSLFPFGSNHLTFSMGRVIELLKYTPEFPSADCQTGWNSSLDRPIHMHRSLQIGLYIHRPINHSLPWAPCGARLAPSCLSGPLWPLYCNNEFPVEKHKEAGVCLLGEGVIQQCITILSGQQ